MAYHTQADRQEAAEQATTQAREQAIVAYLTVHRPEYARSLLLGKDPLPSATDDTPDETMFLLDDPFFALRPPGVD